MRKRVLVKELVGSLKERYRVLGSMDRYVSVPSPIAQAEVNSLSFCSKKGDEALEMLRACKASVIVCSEEVTLTENDCGNRTIIQVENPRLIFIRLVKRFFTPVQEYGIHPTAIIDSRAHISDQVYIGPYSYIGNCQIGNGTVIYGNVYIYSNTKIGSRVTIHAGTVIGADGFGYERNEKGEFEHFPHIGGVIIGDDVEIGSNACIDRGSIGNTSIGDGTKIDNLCHIAHNVNIGKHCAVIALAMIGGSTNIGDYSHVAPSVAIMNKIKVGRNVVVGLGAVVTRNIEDNVVVMGVPAKPHRINVPESFTSL